MDVNFYNISLKCEILKYLCITTFYTYICFDIGWAGYCKLTAHYRNRTKTEIYFENLIVREAIKKIVGYRLIANK